MKTIILIFALIGLTSCFTKEKQERDATIDFFKSQPRDPEIFGQWVKLNDTFDYIYIYKQEGELSRWYAPISDELKFKRYYYTKNDTLFVLTPAIMGKTQNAIHEYKYTIEEDEMILHSYNEGKISEFPSTYKRVK